MNKLNNKCGLFGRISTSRQANPQEGDLNSQFNRMEEFVELKNNNDPQFNWVVVRRYRENGVLGADLDRSEFNQLIQDVKDGSIDTVIVCTTSRIARSNREFFDLWNLLHKHNVQFISLDEVTDVILKLSNLIETTKPTEG